MEMIDLHVHSNCSDGTYSPEQLVAYAIEKGLRAFALTDHDTTDGLVRARAAAKGTNLEVVSGIEFSTEYQGKDIHIVGLDIEDTLPEFTEQLERFQDSRDLRNDKMIAKMQAYGFDISHEKMQAAFGDAVWTRAHFARYLLDAGIVSEMKEAFDKYIGEGKPCFVPREHVTPVQAVHLISRCGGIAVLAHPMLYRLTEEQMQNLLTSLKKAGLVGIEAIYSTHSQQEENLVRLLAKRYGLQISGGSDFHGSNKPAIDLGCGRGDLKIPYTVLTNLRAGRKR